MLIKMLNTVTVAYISNVNVKPHKAAGIDVDFLTLVSLIMFQRGSYIHGTLSLFFMQTFAMS